MNARVIVTLCVVFVLGVAPFAHAQVRAGSPEDKAFQKIDAENNIDAKIALLLDFEKEFAQSTALRDAYLQLVALYQQKNNSAKVIEYSEKILKLDPVNLTALLMATHAYSMEGKQPSLDRAIQYGQKAIDEISKLKAGPPQQGYTDEQWRQYIQTNEELAKNYLSYARALKR
jgi:tetratricopeptide (TPR) repeat protein